MWIGIEANKATRLLKVAGLLGSETLVCHQDHRAAAADWNLALALVPMVVTVLMQTTMIKASITAYSTAVGPSSETRKFLTLFINLFIFFPLCPASAPGIKGI